MASLNPYINFKGNTEEAFNFYKSVFGGDFSSVMRFGELPPMEGAPPTPEAAKNKIMHISLMVGSSMLMGSDAVEGFGPPITEGNDFYISINADSKQQADQYFHTLSAGGKVEMPIGDAFWGSYFGMLQDKFGKKWMISFGNAQHS
jgi:PhnB protein